MHKSKEQTRNKKIWERNVCCSGEWLSQTKVGRGGCEVMVTALVIVITESSMIFNSL